MNYYKGLFFFGLHNKMTKIIDQQDSQCYNVFNQSLLAKYTNTQISSKQKDVHISPGHVPWPSA